MYSKGYKEISDGTSITNPDNWTAVNWNDVMSTSWFENLQIN